MADDLDGVVLDAHDVAVVDGLAVGRGGVADGGGDLAAADLGNGLLHGLGVVLEAAIGVDGAIVSSPMSSIYSGSSYTSRFGEA